MNLAKKWPAWKIGTAVGVGSIVLADVVLCFVLWQMAREAPAEMASRRNELATTAAQLEADVSRVEKIRAELGQVGKGSDDFYNTTFLDAHTVYSTVDADIDAISAKSGVKTTGLNFKQTAVPDHNVTDLDISMTVDGDYPSLLQFVNGIEKSKNFYFLRQLQLGSAGPNGIRLQLDLHTYFRTAG
jgi:Tfp pilus assembly protein PilO